MSREPESERPGVPSTTLDAGDDLVQHLAVAKYALTAGDTERAMAAIDAALALSRASLDSLVHTTGRDAATTFAGALVRNNPAPSPRQHPAC